MLLASFQPTAAQTDMVLDALADPASSLLDIAKANHTSIRALSAWLQSPEIQPHAESIDQALATRARSQAAATFPSLIAAATKSLEAFNQLPAPDFADKDLDPATADRYHRHRLAALRAGWLLLRIARFDPNPPRRHSSRNDDTAPPHRHRADVPPDFASLAALLEPQEVPSAPSAHPAPSAFSSQDEVRPPVCHSLPPRPAAEPPRPIVAAGHVSLEAAPASGAQSFNAFSRKAQRRAAHLAATAGLASGP